ELPYIGTSDEDIISIGRKAAQFIGDHFQKKDFKEEAKDYDNSLVSFVDRESEKIITDVLTNLYPDFGFITEEDTISQDDQRDYYCVIDQLDDTIHFIHDLEEFSVSLALSTWDQELIGGKVIDVMSEDLFQAAKSQGAWKNGTHLHLEPTLL